MHVEQELPNALAFSLFFSCEALDLGKPFATYIFAPQKIERVDQEIGLLLIGEAMASPCRRPKRSRESGDPELRAGQIVCLVGRGGDGLVLW